MKSYKFIVSGLIQEVEYIKGVIERINIENYNGYIKNKSDRTIEACVTCKEENLIIVIDIL